jgi:hypothetical protein
MDIIFFLAMTDTGIDITFFGSFFIVLVFTIAKVKHSVRLSRTGYVNAYTIGVVVISLLILVSGMLLSVSIRLGYIVEILTVAGIGAALSFFSALRSNDAFGAPYWGGFALIPPVPLFLMARAPFDQTPETKPTLGRKVRGVLAFTVLFCITILVIAVGPRIYAVAFEDLKPNVEALSVRDIAMLRSYLISDNLPMRVNPSIEIKDVTGDENGLTVFLTVYADEMDEQDIVTQLSNLTTELCVPDEMQLMDKKGGRITYQLTHFLGRATPVIPAGGAYEHCAQGRAS